MVTAPAKAPVPPEEDQSLATAELELGGMHCSACATRIQRSLGRLPAVASASVNLATTRAFVSYDPVALEHRGAVPGRLRRRLQRVGGRRHVNGSIAIDPDHWGLRAAISWPLAMAALVVALAASGVRHRRVDRADPGRRRRVRRWVALPARRRSSAPPRRHQHGHAHRPRHPGRPGGQRRRSHRTGRPTSPPRRERRLRRPPARGDGPAHRGHPGHRAGRSRPGPGTGPPGPCTRCCPCGRRRLVWWHQRTTTRGSWWPPRASRSAPWSGCDPARPSRWTGRWLRDGRRWTSRC